MNAKHTDEEINAAIVQAGGIRPAAKLLGVDHRSLQRRVRRMEARDKGFVGNVFPVIPAGHHLKGVSSLQKVHDPETGETVMQWVKSAKDAENVELNLRTALDALKSEIPRAELTYGDPNLNYARLASLYVLTDYHLGMYAWKEETGDDWDMNIAEDLLVNWFKLAIESGPNSHTGILAQLGDFLHYDTLEAVTPTAKNTLDADTRAQKMIRVGLRVLRRVVNMLLIKHDHVVVLMAEGNHDIISSVWLREAFKIFYENEPRVTVEVSPDPYYAVQWGKTALFFHHGHLKKPEQVDRVFARKFREMYGACEHVYGHLGHMHHQKVIESSLMLLEQHPTMTAADAYASRHGYLSSRRASVIVYDKEHGEVSRLSFNPEMVNAAQSAFNG
jgi:hypothetical protein